MTSMNFCSFLGSLFVVFSISGCGGSNDNSSNFGGIISGSLVDIPESRGNWIWGDSLNSLCQQWSVARFEISGFFYGTNFPWSSADVFVLKAPVDPLTIIAAENFSYTNDSVEAFEGDTVFFRGRNGFFGAWQISDIEGAVGATLSGTWYFKSGGGGDFTREVRASNQPIHDGTC